MPLKALPLFLLLLFCRLGSQAQMIKGEVRDAEERQALADVGIVNVHTGELITTDAQGAFRIAATSGQLLEFRKPGYKLVRVRIPNGFIPSYFMIIVSKLTARPHDAAPGSDYKADSIRFHDLYAHELDFPKMSAFDMIASPFSALSRKNKEIWQFQEDYDAFEKEKYVDKVFSESVVTRFTGLTGDSLHYYMHRYRPSYEQLRSMNEYSFYNYIRSNAVKYRNINTPRGAQ